LEAIHEINSREFIPSVWRMPVRGKCGGFAHCRRKMPLLLKIKADAKRAQAEVKPSRNRHLQQWKVVLEDPSRNVLLFGHEKAAKKFEGKMCRYRTLDTQATRFAFRK